MTPRLVSDTDLRARARAVIDIPQLRDDVQYLHGLLALFDGLTSIEESETIEWRRLFLVTDHELLVAERIEAQVHVIERFVVLGGGR